MKLSQFQFNLPSDRIATEPPRWRDECKLMVLNKKTGEIEHKLFKDIIEYFGKGDTFVLNDTKVIPARYFSNDGGIELVRAGMMGELVWKCMVRPGKKMKIHGLFVFQTARSVL